MDSETVLFPRQENSTHWLVQWRPRHELHPTLLRAPLPHKQSASRAKGTTIRSKTSFVAFAGYLLNTEELRRITRVDPQANPSELLAACYRRWKTALSKHVQGAFFLTIWDEESEQLIIIRDAMGLHPCYYHWNGDELLVSDSVDVLLAYGGLSAQINRLILAEYIEDRLGYQQREETFYAAIRRLLPAHVLIARRDGLFKERYWDPVPPGFEWASEEELAEFPRRLELAVSRCLAAGADSIALSGGFDSVSIAIAAAKLQNNFPPLNAVSLRFTGTVADEGETQMAVARLLGMPQVVRSITESLNAEDIVEASLAFSRHSPLPVLSLWQSLYTGLMKAAAETRCSHMLMGTGGDDLLNVDLTFAADCLSSGRWYQLWKFYNACRRTSPFSGWQIARLVFWQSALRPVSRRLLAGLAESVFPQTIERLRVRRRHRMQPWITQNDAVLIDHLVERRRYPPFADMLAGKNSYKRQMHILSQAPLLLMEHDQAFAWAEHLGFTLLYPFWDKELVELLLRVHPAQLIAGGRFKTPLRKYVSRNLSDMILPTKKVDFTQTVHKLLRAFAKRQGDDFGLLPALSDLGIIDVRSARRLLEAYQAGVHDRWVFVWQLISAEAWLRARSSPCTQAAFPENVGEQNSSPAIKSYDGYALI